MATQKETGRKFDRSLGDLYLVEHSLYDSENGLNLKVGDIIQTTCENWVHRMGSCVEPIRQLPAKKKAEDIILVEDCVEDGGAALGERRSLSSRDPKSQIPDGASPEDEGNADEGRPRSFKRKGAAGKGASA